METLIGEAERIKRCKGRVFALQDEPEVPRVWLPFDDAPGLAMARAFGDFCLKEYGVISIPEFSHRQLTDRDQFIVIASDGVRLRIFNVISISLVLCLIMLCHFRNCVMIFIPVRLGNFSIHDLQFQGWFLLVNMALLLP